MAFSEGGAIYLDSQGMSLSITSCSFKNVTAPNVAGGFAYIKTARLLSIYDTQILQASSVESQVMSVISTAQLSVTIEKSSIQCRSEEFKEKTVKEQLKESSSELGPAIFVKNAYSFSVRESKFTQCLFASKGGVFYI